MEIHTVEVGKLDELRVERIGEKRFRHTPQIQSKI